MMIDSSLCLIAMSELMSMAEKASDEKQCKLHASQKRYKSEMSAMAELSHKLSRELLHMMEKKADAKSQLHELRSCWEETTHSRKRLRGGEGNQDRSSARAGGYEVRVKRALACASAAEERRVHAAAVARREDAIAWSCAVRAATETAVIVVEAESTDGSSVVVFIGRDRSKRFLHSRLGNEPIDPFDAEFSLKRVSAPLVLDTTRVSRAPDSA